MPSARSALLVIPLDWSYGRQIIRGIHHYAKPARPWSLSNPKKTSDRTCDYDFYRYEHRIDGIIAITDQEVLGPISRVDSLPVVWIEASPLEQLGPREALVGIDVPAIASLSVEHFAERGYRQFAVYGGQTPGYAQSRSGALADAVAEAGLQVDVFDFGQEYDAGAPEFPHVKFHWEQIHQWIVTLPKPVAILTADDRAAWVCSEVCRRTDIPVPEEVAILGVGDDDMYCQMAYPPLSSVQVPGERLGFLAANILERLMDGNTLNSQEVRLPPSGVVSRMSSDTLAIDDAHVAAALRFIRNHAHEQIGVADVLKVVPLSRRVLEQRFQKLVGRGPYAEIQRHRIDHVRQMLAETDLTLDRIAERCGYNSVNRMSLAFRQAEGVSPGAYRKRFFPSRVDPNAETPSRKNRSSPG